MTGPPAPPYPQLSPRRSRGQVWAIALIALSAAIGIAAAVVAAVMIGPINEAFERSPEAPTGGIKFAVTITIIVSILMIAFGVWYYLAGTHTPEEAVVPAWVLFLIVVCTACFAPGWFTGAFLMADPGGSGQFTHDAFVKSIPDWLPTTSLILTFGKVVTFFAATMMLSSARS